ncbi:hypothetical protein [Thioclava sp.]|uniref:hypothetical protein n=1 Tax=Thioclava sp. TaxID=1933450 RepID=UPI003242D832
MDLNKIKNREQPYREGMWIDGIPNLDDVRLLVRPITSPEVLRVTWRLMREAPKEGRTANGGLTPEAQTEIDREVLACAGLLGWENLLDGKKPIKFSVEKARDLLSLDAIFEGTRYACAMAQTKVDEQRDALAKN